jgi:shikimate kinase
LQSESDSTPRSTTPGHDGEIVVVGPCGAGKSTLVEALRARRIAARQIAQEHSHVDDLWRHRTAQVILVYLDASFQTCTDRKHFTWPVADYQEQIRRLARARRECDVFVATDGLTPEAVLQGVLDALAPGTSDRTPPSESPAP